MTEASASESPVDEAEHHQRSGTPVAKASTSRRSGAWIGWLALLFSLAALALSLRDFWPMQQPAVDEFADVDAHVDELDHRLDSFEEEITRLTRRLSEIETGFSNAIDNLPAPVDAVALEDRLQDQMQDRLAVLARRLEQLSGQSNTEFGTVRGRLDEMESEFTSRVERLAARLDRAGRETDRQERDWLERLRLIEVRHLLDAVENATDIFADRQTAIAALERIAERAALGDRPGWARLNEAARQDLAAVHGWSAPVGFEQIRRLMTASEATAQWPVAGRPKAEKPAGSGPDDSSQVAQGPGWRDRIGQVLGDLVHIETLDPDQLSPVAEDRLRQRVGALLHAAAMTLARREFEQGRDLIEQARGAIETGFDASDREVAAVLSSLDALDRSLVSASGPPQPERTRQALETLERQGR